MWWYQGAEKWRIDCITTTDLHLRFYNPSVGEVMKLFTTGALTIADALTTGAPAGGTAGAWKFGVYVTGAAVLDAAHYVQLDVGGTLYKLALAQ